MKIQIKVNPTNVCELMVHPVAYLVYFVDFFLETLQFLNESTDGHVPGAIYVHSQEGRPKSITKTVNILRLDPYVDAEFTQPRDNIRARPVVPSISVSRKLPAINLCCVFH